MGNSSVSDAEDAYIQEAIANGKEPDIKELQKYAKRQGAKEFEEWEKVQKNEKLDEVAETKRRRGRPPKEREAEPEHKAAIADVALDEVTAWKAEINAAVTREFPALNAAQVKSIADNLTDFAGHYKYGAQLRAHQKTKTNKRHIEKSILIRDCAKVWEEITGKPLTVWIAENRNGDIEPAGTKLARIVAEAVGTPLARDLREHAETAKEIIEIERKQ